MNPFNIFLRGSYPPHLVREQRFSGAYIIYIYIYEWFQKLNYHQTCKNYFATILVRFQYDFLRNCRLFKLCQIMGWRWVRERVPNHGPRRAEPQTQYDCLRFQYDFSTTRRTNLFGNLDPGRGRMLVQSLQQQDVAVMGTNAQL